MPHLNVFSRLYLNHVVKMTALEAAQAAQALADTAPKVVAAAPKQLTKPAPALGAKALAAVPPKNLPKKPVHVAFGTATGVVAGAIAAAPASIEVQAQEAAAPVPIAAATTMSIESTPTPESEAHEPEQNVRNVGAATTEEAFGCEFDCEFAGTVEAVSAHESQCPDRAAAAAAGEEPAAIEARAVATVAVIPHEGNVADPDESGSTANAGADTETKYF